MKPYEKKWYSSFCLRLLAALFMLMLLPPWPQTCQANGIQRQIFGVGINLGMAQAILDFVAPNNPGAVDVAAGLMRQAANFVQAAASSYPEPFNTDRRRNGVDRRVVDKINQFVRSADRMPANQRSNYAKSTWGMYRQSFQDAFMANSATQTQTASYHNYPTCDFFVLDLAYHYGYAMFTAGIQGDRARSAQGAANTSFRNAVLQGLKVGINGIPYGPRNNVRKACCAFGPEDRWAQIPDLQSSSRPDVYERFLPALEGMVTEMIVLPGDCGGTTVADNNRGQGHGQGEGQRRVGQPDLQCPSSLMRRAIPGSINLCPNVRWVLHQGESGLTQNQEVGVFKCAYYVPNAGLRVCRHPQVAMSVSWMHSPSPNPNRYNFYCQQNRRSAGQHRASGTTHSLPASWFLFSPTKMVRGIAEIEYWVDEQLLVNTVNNWIKQLEPYALPCR